MLIIWSEDDCTDPYPAVLEALKEAFLLADPRRSGDNMSEDEFYILDHIRESGRQFLESADPKSSSFLDAANG